MEFLSGTSLFGKELLGVKGVEMLYTILLTFLVLLGLFLFGVLLFTPNSDYGVW